MDSSACGFLSSLSPEVQTRVLMEFQHRCRIEGQRDFSRLVTNFVNKCCSDESREQAAYDVAQRDREDDPAAVRQDARAPLTEEAAKVAEFLAELPLDARALDLCCGSSYEVQSRAMLEFIPDAFGVSDYSCPVTALVDKHRAVERGRARTVGRVAGLDQMRWAEMAGARLPP